jgi:hypothetical protein
MKVTKMKTTSKPELGDEVVCLVTGFKGIITSIAQCLTGCDRVVIQPPICKDGKFADSLWVDVTAVKIVKKGKINPSAVQAKAEEPVRKTGGPPTRGFP